MVPTRLLIVGKQGSGKGTQCVMLSRYFAAPHISTGEMLRVAVKSQSPLGAKVKEIMERGDLIPDDVITEVVASRIGEDDCIERGWILDGFPRTLPQAMALDEMLGPAGIEHVVELEVSTEQTIRRMTTRRVCASCGAIYSTHKPPQVNWSCDVCGGEVRQRDDDKEEAIRKRLVLYDTETLPVLGWYEKQGLLIRVNGMGSPDAVFRRTLKALGSEPA